MKEMIGEITNATFAIKLFYKKKPKSKFLQNALTMKHESKSAFKHTETSYLYRNNAYLSCVWLLKNSFNSYI